jgi:hypothetical protein
MMQIPSGFLNRPRHRIAREPRLIGGGGVADKLFHRAR